MVQDEFDSTLSKLNLNQHFHILKNGLQSESTLKKKKKDKLNRTDFLIKIIQGE